MTQIDAINKMLRYVGELPPPSTVIIDNLPDGHEAKTAKTILQEASREAQKKGWWFNSEQWVFIPDNSGYITIPNIIISLRSTNVNNEYTIKGGDLYDVKQKTKIFTDKVTLDVVFESDFEDLPETFNDYVVYVAAKYLHTYLNADEITQKELLQLISTSYVEVQREHLRNKKYNAVKGTRLADRTVNPEAVS